MGGFFGLIFAWASRRWRVDTGMFLYDDPAPAPDPDDLIPGPREDA